MCGSVALLSTTQTTAYAIPVANTTTNSSGNGTAGSGSSGASYFLGSIVSVGIITAAVTLF
jgi:hypothetical protein